MFLKRFLSFFLAFIIVFQFIVPSYCYAYEFTYTNLPDKNDYPANADGAVSFYWDTALTYINNSTDFIEPIIFSMDENKKQEYNDFFGVDIFTDDGDYAPLSSLLTDYYIDHRNYKDSGGYRPGAGQDNVSPEYSFFPSNDNSTFISDGWGGGFTIVNNSQYSGKYSASYDCAVYYNGRLLDHRTGYSSIMKTLGDNYLGSNEEYFQKYSGIAPYGFSLPEYKYSLSKSPDGKSITFNYCFYSPCSDNISDKLFFDFLTLPENPDSPYVRFRKKLLHLDWNTPDPSSPWQCAIKWSDDTEYGNYLTISKYTVNKPLESSVDEYNNYFRFVTYNPVTNNIDNSQNITYGADNSGQSCYYYNNQPYSFTKNVNSDGTFKIGSDNVFLIPDFKTLNQTDKNGISDLIKNWYLMQLLRLSAKKDPDLAPLYNYLASMLNSFSALSSMVGNIQTLLNNIYNAIRNINQLNPYDQLMLNELINIKNLLMLGSDGTSDKLSLEKIEKLLEKIEENTRPPIDEDVTAEEFEIDWDIQDVMQEFYDKFDVPGYFKLFQLAFKNLTGRDIDIDLTDYLSVEKYLVSDESEESAVAPLLYEATETNAVQARAKSVSLSAMSGGGALPAPNTNISDISVAFGSGHTDTFFSISDLNLFYMLKDVDADFEVHLASARNLVRIFLVVSFMFYEFRKITQLIQAVFGSDKDISSAFSKANKGG